MIPKGAISIGRGLCPPPLDAHLPAMALDSLCEGNRLVCNQNLHLDHQEWSNIKSLRVNWAFQMHIQVTVFSFIA